MRSDLLQGTLDMLVLRALTWGPMHGYGIARWLEERTEEALRIEEGSLYPALHRMQKRGWVGSQWGVSENNRRARYYTLTPAGLEQLGVEADTWGRLTAAVQKVLEAEPA